MVPMYQNHWKSQNNSSKDAGAHSATYSSWFRDEKKGGTPYVLKKGLFTSLFVLFLYERGWRQCFTQFGSPGPDKDFDMATTFFSSHLSNDRPSVIVDMSCVTALFTHRFASSGLYKRMIGWDYSDSVLQEAWRHIQSNFKLQSKLHALLARRSQGKGYLKSIVSSLSRRKVLCLHNFVKVFTTIHRSRFKRLSMILKARKRWKNYYVMLDLERYTWRFYVKVA